LMACNCVQPWQTKPYTPSKTIRWNSYEARSRPAARDYATQTWPRESSSNKISNGFILPSIALRCRLVINPTPRETLTLIELLT
jgi:hypothetical protein